MPINLMLLDKNIKQLLEVICEEKISVVTTGAGSPKEISLHSFQKTKIKGKK